MSIWMVSLEVILSTLAMYIIFPEPLKIIETGVNDIKVTINDDMSSFLRLGARLIGRYRLLSWRHLDNIS